MNLVFVLLGFFDTVAAALILFPSYFPFSEALMLYAMMYLLIKGSLFFLTALSSRNIHPLCMGFNIIDIITGLILGSIVLGIPLGVFEKFAFVSALKGLYCFIFPIFS